MKGILQNIESACTKIKGLTVSAKADKSSISAYTITLYAWLHTLFTYLEDAWKLSVDCAADNFIIQVTSIGGNSSLRTMVTKILPEGLQITAVSGYGPIAGNEDFVEQAKAAFTKFGGLKVQNVCITNQSLERNVAVFLNLGFSQALADSVGRNIHNSIEQRQAINFFTVLVPYDVMPKPAADAFKEMFQGAGNSTELLTLATAFESKIEKDEELTKKKLSVSINEKSLAKKAEALANAKVELVEAALNLRKALLKDKHVPSSLMSEEIMRSCICDKVESSANVVEGSGNPLLYKDLDKTVQLLRASDRDYISAVLGRSMWDAYYASNGKASIKKSIPEEIRVANPEVRPGRRVLRREGRAQVNLVDEQLNDQAEPEQIERRVDWNYAVRDGAGVFENQGIRQQIVQLGEQR